MKIAYLDCFSGISGDMTVAAFLDAGLKLSVLGKHLRALGLKGYRIAAARLSKNGISATKFDVQITGEPPRATVDYKRIKKLLERSRLAAGIKKRALLMFENLAKAEAKVHGRKALGDVHFHEVGAVDSIIDIVGAAIAAEELGIERFYCLNLNCGSLPAPASLELLKNIPFSFLDYRHELITPTGAAILKTFVNDFRARPALEIKTIGYGAGAFQTSGRPNLLRLIIGDSKGAGLSGDEVIVIETSIDDMNPVHYEYVIEKLFEKGALDVYLTSIYMKKTRPGVLITVLAKEYLLDTLAGLIMKETTSSGIRYYKAGRRILDRVVKVARTRYGQVRIKVNSGPGGIETVSPEYEDCKMLARQTGAPLKAVFDEARNYRCGRRTALYKGLPLPAGERAGPAPAKAGVRGQRAQPFPSPLRFAQGRLNPLPRGEC